MLVLRRSLLDSMYKVLVGRLFIKWVLVLPKVALGLLLLIQFEVLVLVHMRHELAALTAIMRLHRFFQLV